MFQLKAGKWVSQSGILVTSWWSGSTALPEDSILNKHRLMSMILMDRSSSMELYHKLVEDDLTLGPEKIT
jgi:hypothetical protein